MSSGLAYSRRVRLENRSPLANGVAPCLAPVLSTAPCSLTSSLINVGALCTGEWCHTASTRGHGWSSCSTNLLNYRTSQPGLWWNCTPIPSDSGATVDHVGTSLLPIKQAAGVSPFFPPRDQAIVKAIAGEAVCQTKLPLSRLSSSDLAGRAATALGKPISPSTVWRSSTPTRSSPGGTSTGSFPATHSSPTKPGASWTCTPACGTVSRWAAGTTSSARTRRRASRPASGVTRLCRLVRAVQCALSTNMGGVGLCSTSLPGMSAAEEFWVDANRRPVSPRSAAWSIK